MHKVLPGLATAATLALATTQGALAMGWLFGSDFEGYTPPKPSDANIEALRNRALSELVYIPGGSFLFGNVRVPVILDGETREDYIYGPIVDENRAPIEVESFYAAPFEITNADFDLYAAANGLELRPDMAYTHARQGPYPARIAYHQAQAYCDWLTELTGQPFALPTSRQWEFAARSGGRDVAYATQDGAYDYLESLYRHTLERKTPEPHLPDAFAPNPYGLHAMSSNLAEWVLDSWADPETGEIYPDGFTGDPEAKHRRVWRGANYLAQAELNSIYMYGAAGPVERTRWLEMFPTDASYFEDGADIAYFAQGVGARCVVNVADDPERSGFGRPPGPVPANFPAAITPLPRR